MDQQQPPQMPPEPAPQMPPPQQQPQWTPPPQQPTGWGGPSYGAPPPRPMGVTLAGIFLIVMGVLLALAGAACGIGGGLLAGAGASAGDQSGIFSFLAGLGLVFGLIALVFGILQIAAGAGSLGGRGWARITGIILSVLFAIFAILGGLGSLGSQDGATGGITTLVVGVLYALTAYALISAGGWFAARR